MFSVTIRQHIMIAHSLPHPDFGPAQRLHGATYVTDVTFYSPQLTEMGIVIDIALAHDALRKALAPLDYQNLDELPQFKGKLTTTEFLAQYIHGQVKAAVAGQFDGRIKVVLGESHEAWAAYEA
ncbi:MAG: 6-carboxytetrahydropterin synthase [bacterium]|jgi:6-pyruvoyl-tetrahydropterin synthase|nr:6-carboxytetrahydropterin synthase [bacterium]